MPYDLMTSLLGNGAGLPFPGAYSLKNPYSWLDDLPDNHQRSTGKAHDSKNLTKSSGKAASPASIIDLTNRNGKRPQNFASSAYGEPESKKMRIKNNEYGWRPTDGQEGTPGRPVHVDLSGSPPPTHRSYREHRLNGHHPPSADPSKNTLVPKSSRKTWTSSNRSGSMNLPEVDAKEAAPNPLSSSSHPQQTSQSAVKRESDAPAISFATKGPFDVDDSSDDERASKPAQPLRTPSTSPPRVIESKRLQSRPQTALSHRERQIQESRKRRQEAAQRKREPQSSSRGAPYEVHSGERQDDEMEMEYTWPPPERSRANDQRTRKDPASIFRTSAMHTSPAKDSVIDLTENDAKDLPTKPRPEEKKRPPKVPGSSEKPRNIFEGRRSTELVEARRQKNAELHARVQALDNKEKEQTEVSRAAEAKREKESNELQKARARVQEEYTRQVAAQAEMAQRSRARVEANRREAQQEAEAKRREEEKRGAEQREWDEQERIKEQHRETLRKRQAEADKEKRSLEDQQAALARLNAARPPQQPPQESPRNEQKVETDINKIVSKHTTPQSLHFKRDNGSMAADTARNKVKEIQDRNAQGGLLQPKPGSISETSRREDRIKALEERNARLREAEKRANEDEDDGLRRIDRSQTPKHSTRLVEQVEGGDSKPHMPGPPALALPGGPQSLRSAAGQALLAQANADPATTTGKRATEKQRSNNHGRQLGEILLEDVQLVKWRDEGIRFEDIVTLWKRQFPPSRTQDTLRKRYRQVKEALKSASIDQHLLDRILAGSGSARKEVNVAVHGQWPLPVAPKNQRDAQGHFLPKHEQSGGGQSGGAGGATTVVKSGLLTPNWTSSFASSTAEQNIAADEDAASRPHVGGKRLGPEAYAHYLEHIREVYAEDGPEAETLTPREQSPISGDDYCHFAYQVQRREISQQDLDDGFVIDDDDPWQVCDEPLDKLSKANKKAAKEAACIPKKWKHEGDSEPEYEIRSRNLQDGKKMFKAIWHGIGEVQVRVARYIRYHQDNVRPTSKNGWAPKSVYSVRERKVEKTGDDVFSESKETDVTRNVDNAVYTTLEQANTMAIRHFVSLTFESKSANLTQRDIEGKEMEKKIESEFAEEEGNQDGEGPCFRKEIETEDGRTKVEVWVEKEELKGPRNL